MKRFLDEINKKVLIYDGSKGYMFQKLGMKGGECGELWNIDNPEKVKEVYRLYKEAGSDVIQTNTFTGSRIHLDKHMLGDRVYELNYAGAKLAREVAEDDIFVAASIGPTGMLFEPYGELTFELAYEIYAEQLKALADGGVDLINFETFTDIAEMRAALIAAKETADLPVICSMAFESNGRTLMGTEPDVIVNTLLSLGADMVGANCSFGAEYMLKIVKSMHDVGAGLLSIKPNAGMPVVQEDRVYYKQSPEDFAELSYKFIEYGAGLVGGCCGTTPEFIKALKDKIEGTKASINSRSEVYVITSSNKAVNISSLDAGSIGKLKLSPDKIATGRILEGDYSYIEDLVQDISDEGNAAVVIDVEDIGDNEIALLKTVDIAQTFIKAPLIFKALNMNALEKCIRVYNGVAGLASPCNDEATTKNIHKLAAKYGSKVLLGN